MSSRLFKCAIVAALMSVFSPSRADACGGFFCSSAPVDQSAERIVFAIDEQAQRTEMIVQISYQGADDAFAWLLPVAAVPENRAVFPNGALVPLDAQTGPVFVPPDNCGGRGGLAVPRSASSDDSVDEGDGVNVIVQETVGPYDVVVLESADAEKTFTWLSENKYRLAPAMKPYLALYTAQGMKFLALKLTANATVQDIQPFRMTLPGTTPSIPLRLTAVAAEPEMGIVVWILGARRYEPANAPELEIATADLKYSLNSFPIRTNWTELVARKVDEWGGRGWVVEQAGPTASVTGLLTNSFANTPDQLEARDALLALFTGKTYMTRLYTRVSAEEMGYDPNFKQSDKGDVDRQRTLPFSAAQCSGSNSTNPCDFSSCGQLGLCATAMDKSVSSAACACAPGSTARAIAGPQGLTVNCQDQRMSFMNPGDRDDSGNVLPDPCVGYDCGAHGRCVAMNLTPTCECEQNFVATASMGGTGKRQVLCQEPSKAIAKNFYNRRPPALAPGMVEGRAVALSVPVAQADVSLPTMYGEPAVGAPAKADDGCRLGGNHREHALLAALFAAGLFASSRRKRS